MSTLHTIDTDVHYRHKNDHRDQSQNKSQWEVSEAEERGIFSNTYKRGWYGQAVGWGLHLENKSIRVLGVGVNRQRQLFFARFVDGNVNNIWHGYPADYLEHQQDVPDPIFLSIWCSEKYMSAAKMRKILRRQPCNL